jgi:outer membrane protein assembly factor BamB
MDMSITRRLAPALAALSLLSFACEAPHGGAGSRAPVASPDPRHNRAILTSKNEEVLQVDPQTGAHQTLVRFEPYTAAHALDVAGSVAYVWAQDGSLDSLDLGTRRLVADIRLAGASTPVLAAKDGVAFVVRGGAIVAVDLASGQARWRHPLEGVGGAPTVTADRLFVATSHEVLAIDRKTGARLWGRPLARELSGSIRLAADTLLVPAGPLLALDAATGDTRWQLEAHAAGTPCVEGSAVLVQAAIEPASSRLLALDLVSGRARWSLESGNADARRYAPLVVGDVVYGVYERGSSVASSGNGRPFVAEIATGRVLWSNDDVSVDTSPVHANGRVFFHGQNFRAARGAGYDNWGLMALDDASGAVAWLNSYFGEGAVAVATPIVLADNGVFRSAE